MVTTVPYIQMQQPETSATVLQWGRAEDLKPEAPYISILPLDPLENSRLLSPEIPFQVPQRGSESVVVDIEKVMEWLARKVLFENPHSIREYLLRFSGLLDVIPQAADAAKKHFPEAQLVMDVYQDPEIADCYLVLYIRVRHYDDSVIERLDKAEAEFLNQLVNKRGWIQLTTDFRKPEPEDAI